MTAVLRFPATVQSRSWSSSTDEKPKLEAQSRKNPNPAESRPGKSQQRINLRHLDWSQTCSRPHSSTFSTTTWTDSSSCPVFAFAFSIVSVSLSGAYGSCSSAGWPVWPCQTLLSNSFGSVKSTPRRPQLQSPSHSPGHLLGPQVAPGT